LRGTKQSPVTDRDCFFTALKRGRFIAMTPALELRSMSKGFYIEFVLKIWRNSMKLKYNLY